MDYEMDYEMEFEPNVQQNEHEEERIVTLAHLANFAAALAVRILNIEICKTSTEILSISTHSHPLTLSKEHIDRRRMWSTPRACLLVS